MIRVDRRIGSVELAGPLKVLGAPVTVCTLAFGDFRFLGHGPNGLESVGIERKTVGDLVSCLMDNRFAGHQLPGLIRDYTVRYLVVEGPYRPARDGILESGKLWSWNGAGNKSGVTWGSTLASRHSLMYRDFDGFLSSIQEQGQVSVIRTLTLDETAHWVHSRYSWWAKRWADHKSLQPMLKQLRLRSRDPGKDDNPEALRYTKASTLRKMIAQIPCIGWIRSAAVETYFQSWETLMAAPAKEWCQIPGIGPVIARTAWRELHASIPSTPTLASRPGRGSHALSPDARRRTPRPDRG